MIRTRLTSGAKIQSKYLLDPLQGHELTSLGRILMHLFNAFWLMRVRGVPKKMIKALFKIGCPWFKHWSVKTEVEYPYRFDRQPDPVDRKLQLLELEVFTNLF